MAKEKLKLNELKVQSIVTSLEEGQMQTLKGGKEVVGPSPQLFCSLDYG
jgi:hypothetical protein